MEECDRVGRQDDGERTDSARRKDRQEAEGLHDFPARYVLHTPVRFSCQLPPGSVMP